jgi:hypothetical protein
VIDRRIEFSPFGDEITEISGRRGFSWLSLEPEEPAEENSASLPENEFRDKPRTDSNCSIK